MFCNELFSVYYLHIKVMSCVEDKEEADECKGSGTGSLLQQKGSSVLLSAVSIVSR